MIDTLISSKTRIRLLLKFFVNQSTKAHLRGLEAEFGESSNSIRLELNRLEEAGMLNSEVQGNKKLYTANQKHPLFSDIYNIVRKHIGLDQVMEQVVHRLGQIQKVYLTGSFSRGLDGPTIDLLIIGSPDSKYLQRLIQRTEEMIHRKLNCQVIEESLWSDDQLQSFTTAPLLIFENVGGVNII